jgi:hemolysin activation/secretion protein
MGRLGLISIGVALSGASVLASMPAFAQNTRSQSTIPTPQQLNPSQLTPERRHARANDIFAAPEPGPCPLASSQLTFTLKSVSLKGATGMDAARLTDAYRDRIGQTIKVSEICEIRDRAAAMLFSAGILARVEIPEQKISDGQLSLEVIEARIASIHFHGDAGPAQAKVEEYLEKLRGLAPFDLNVAQRYLLLAADVPGVQISAAIRPSPEGRGAVDLDVTIRRKIMDVAVNVEDFGSAQLGPWAGLGRMDLKALTPFGDRSALVLYSTADGHEQQIVQWIEEFRPGDSGLSLRGSASYAHTEPGGSLTDLKLRGDALDVELTADYPVIRRRNYNLNVLGGFSYVNQDTDYPGGVALIDDKLRIFYLRAESNLHERVFGMPLDGALAIEERKGVAGLGASRAGQNDLSRAEGVPDAWVTRVEGHLSLDPSAWFEFYIGGQYQYATTPLLTYEQVALGNLTIGRGYDPSSVAGDRGGAASFEARFGPLQLPLGVRASTYGFYDIGDTYYVDTRQGVTVRSAGGGFRFATAAGFDLDIGYADPFDRPYPSAQSRPPPRLLFTLTYRR